MRAFSTSATRAQAADARSRRLLTVAPTKALLLGAASSTPSADAERSSAFLRFVSEAANLASKSTILRSMRAASSAARARRRLGARPGGIIYRLLNLLLALLEARQEAPAAASCASRKRAYSSLSMAFRASVGEVRQQRLVLVARDAQGAAFHEDGVLEAVAGLLLFRVGLVVASAWWRGGQRRWPLYCSALTACAVRCL